MLATAEDVRITHAGVEVARHVRSTGRRGRIVDRRHFDCVVGAAGRAVRRMALDDPDGGAAPAAAGALPALLPPLAEYEAAAVGSW